jgi:CubicO group peptidase (beta-lactamase class C family)
MKRIIVATLVCLFAVWGGTGFSFAKTGIHNGYGRVTQALNDYFTGLAAAENFSGSVLVAKEGKILLQKGYGMANVESGIANTPNTVHAIASLTKAFTSMSIMMLEERGLLSVDDPVSKYVPELLHGDRITVHQLLNHTSGLYLYVYHPLLWPNKDNFHTPDQLLDYYMYEPLRFEPGAQWEYCNSGYVTLGIIIERVSGMSYRDFIKKNILQPLKMKHTSYDPYETDFLDKAIGYDDIAADPPLRAPYFHPSIPFSAGAVYSTVRDMYRWDQALYTDQLVSYVTLERMFTPGLGNYGYGWYSDTLEVDGRGHKHIWHWGAYFGFHGYFSRLVDDNVTVILLRNTSPVLGIQDELRPIAARAAGIVLAY